MFGDLFDKMKYKYLILINLFTVAAFYVDKKCAHSNFKYFQRKRISESFLHALTVLGGSPGSIFSIYFFRHKNKKLSFLIVTYSIFLFQCYLLWNKHNKKQQQVINN